MRYLVCLALLFVSVQLLAQDIPDKGVCLVEYVTDNCGACVRLSQELKLVQGITVLKFKDVPGVASYPVLIYYIDGKAKEACIGWYSADEIRAKIRELTGATK